MLKSEALVCSNYPLNASRFAIVDVLDHLLGIQDCIGEVEGVTPSYKYMQGTVQGGSQCRPLLLDDVSQVKMIPPILSHSPVDLACKLVIDSTREAVFADRRENSLPCVPLPARASVFAQNQFSMVLFLNCRNDVSIGSFVARPRGSRVSVTVARHRSALEVRVIEVRVFLFVQVDGGEAGKSHRVRACCESCIEVLGVKNWVGERLPTTSRAPEDAASPASSKASVPGLHGRDELLDDGIAVGAHARRVHCVGIIEEGHWVIDGHQEHSGTNKGSRAVGSPILVQVVSIPISDARVAIFFGAALRLSGLKATSSPPLGRVVTMSHDQRITSISPIRAVELMRKQNTGL
mmetsp:Transcript_75414/g.157215  ORF Transcript_75414/g.157215 Transcript_75414/m.157215 type:complete len:349 (-) Transcript_75414:813-1859(-)